MELDDRKIQILKTIIQTYLETGEPVGSRTISKSMPQKLSSATIRNEMVDLEEMGYILQPHTSAGRIPSDKGYRFYVDELIREKETETTALRAVMVQKVDRLEDMLRQLAKILAMNTNYASMVSTPHYKRAKVKFIQLSRVDTGKLLIVTVLEGNIIKNSIVNVSGELTDEELLNLNILLNNSMNGLTITEINLDLITRMKAQAGERREIVDMVLTEVAEVIKANEEDLQIYTGGTTNIFKYPELADGQKASELISTLEQKDLLRELLVETTDSPGAEERNDIQVYIGSENTVEPLSDCSVVTARYDLGDGLQGTVGIIGPKRMDYEKVVSSLRGLIEQMRDTFGDKENKEDEGSS